jgi:hypothetical protein
MKNKKMDKRDLKVKELFFEKGQDIQPIIEEIKKAGNNPIINVFEISWGEGKDDESVFYELSTSYPEYMRSDDQLSKKAINTLIQLVEGRRELVEKILRGEINYQAETSYEQGMPYEQRIQYNWRKEDEKQS